MSDNVELVQEWRGIAVGDVYEIPCFPGHRKIVTKIEYFFPRFSGIPFFDKDGPTVEWARVYGCPWQDGRDPRACSGTDLHVSDAGDPIWRRYGSTDDLMRLGYWPTTDYPIVIVQPGPGRAFRQRPLFEVAS